MPETEDMKGAVVVGSGWPTIMAYGLDRVRQDMIDAQRYRVLRDHDRTTRLKFDDLDRHADDLLATALAERLMPHSGA